MIYRYIYKITCTNGSFKDHFYFGQRTTEINPLIDKYKGSGHRLLDYYKKYPNDYIKEIISFHNSEEDLNKAEYEIIHPWLGNKMCLNLIEGGYYGKPSYETRKKISESRKGMLKGKSLSEEHKRKISEARKGYKMPQSTKNKLSDIAKNQWKDPKNREKMSESLKGKPVWNKGLTTSEETKKKLSLSHIGKQYHKGHHLSEERKQYLSNYFTGRPNEKNKGEKNGMYGKNAVNRKRIIQYDLNHNIIKVWDCLKDISKELHISLKEVINTCKYRRDSFKNFIWRYETIL